MWNEIELNEYYFEWCDDMGLDANEESSYDAYREYVLERREGVS